MMFDKLKDRLMFKRRGVDERVQHSEQQLAVEQETLNDNLNALARITIIDGFQRDLQDMFTGKVRGMGRPDE